MLVHVVDPIHPIQHIQFFGSATRNNGCETGPVPVHRRMLVQLVPWAKRNLWQECLVLHQVVAMSYYTWETRLSSDLEQGGSVETSGRHLFRRAAIMSRNLSCGPLLHNAYQGMV